MKKKDNKEFTEGTGSGLILIIFCVIAGLLIGGFYFIQDVLDNSFTFYEKLEASTEGLMPDEDISEYIDVLDNRNSIVRLSDLGITFEELKEEYNTRTTLNILESKTNLDRFWGAFCSLNFTGVAIPHPTNIIDEVWVVGLYSKGSPIQNIFTQREQKEVFKVVADVYTSKMQNKGVGKSEINKFEQAILKCNEIELDESQNAMHITILTITNGGICVWKWAYR